jgi:Uncharacterised nucleotidyltransferase
MSPEFKLVLVCCRAGRAEDLEAELDWAQFVTLAEQHRVVPQVYGQLVGRAGLLPEQEFLRLERMYRASAQKALWFTGELIRILNHLANQGITAIPYKGPALAQTLYGEVTARQFSDLDLLVLPGDVPGAKNALSALGYRPTIELSATEQRAYIESGYEYSFNGAAGPHLVELQWRILPRFYAVELELASLFERAHSIEMGGEHVRSLHADDLLLVLCVHAAKHVWSQLSWICDIARLAQSPAVDWDEVWKRAQELGVRRIVALSLVLARNLVGLDMPPCAAKWTGPDGSMESILPTILHGLHSCWDTESLEYFRVMLRLRERWGDRAKFVSRLMSTPSVSEWKTVRLPEPLFPLYTGVRLMRLMRRAVSMSGARREPFSLPTG